MGTKCNLWSICQTTSPWMGLAVSTQGKLHLFPNFHKVPFWPCPSFCTNLLSCIWPICDFFSLSRVINVRWNILSVTWRCQTRGKRTHHVISQGQHLPKGWSWLRRHKNSLKPTDIPVQIIFLWHTIAVFNIKQVEWELNVNYKAEFFSWYMS